MNDLSRRSKHLVFPGALLLAACASSIVAAQQTSPPQGTASSKPSAKASATASGPSQKTGSPNTASPNTGPQNTAPQNGTITPPVIAPVQQTEPPKPIKKVEVDKPVVVQPIQANKPAPDTVSPTAPTTSKPLPGGVEAVAPGPSPIATPGTLSAPAPAVEVVRPDRYFLLVFGSQSTPKRAKYTHTWATIVKAVPAKNDPAKFDLTSHTISWLPRTLNVRVLTLRGECGVNLSLKQTLNYVRSCGECVAMWGPYELDPAVAPQIYDKFLRQIARLNSGRVLYKAMDPDHGPRSTYISNCIHAITDLDGLNRRGNYDEIRNHGFSASQYLAGVMIRSGKVDSSVTHEWVTDALDINCYPIQRRMIMPCRPPQMVQQPVVQQPVILQPTVVPPAEAQAQAATR